MTFSETMTPPPGFIEEIEARGLFAGWKKREPQPSTPIAPPATPSNNSIAKPKFCIALRISS